MKPTNITNHEHIFKFSAISIAGDNSDQKEAAIMTPAANPSIASIKLLFTFLNMNTTQAPSAVINHVKVVAIKTCLK